MNKEENTQTASNDLTLKPFHGKMSFLLEPYPASRI
jgi:hypothetical protein